MSLYFWASWTASMLVRSDCAKLIVWAMPKDAPMVDGMMTKRTTEVMIPMTEVRLEMLRRRIDQMMTGSKR